MSNEALPLLCLLLLATPAVADEQAGRYLEVSDYVAAAFPEGIPESRTLWVTGELRETVERVLGHPFAQLRVRYWDHGRRSAWVLDEIGKELPITVGVTVADGAIVDVRVLEFRESRGWEVRYPFFTDRFRGVALAADGRLDQDIDGITGATLSVQAVKRVARIALIFDEQIRRKT